jgi:hypothetical protein
MVQRQFGRDPLAAREVHPFAPRARVQALAGEQHACLDQFFIEFARGCKQLRAGHLAGL